MKPLRYLLLPLLLLASGCHTPNKPALDLIDIRQFQSDAERGDAVAQAHLGAAYATHLRFAEANYWYLKAANRGVPMAQYGLGKDYYEGAGLPKDVTEAYAWFTVASGQGDLAARNAREDLLVKLPRSETDAGDRRTAELLRIIPAEDLRYLLTPEAAGVVTNLAVSPRQATQSQVAMRRSADAARAAEKKEPVFQPVPAAK
jgi:TPR repeat protein